MTTGQNSCDFFFAWRWLLPFRPGGSLFFSGLSDTDIDWWRNVESPGSYSVNTAAPDGGLIALGDDAMPAPADLAALNWVCAWGGASQIGKLRSALPSAFVSVREYGLLPAGNPRVVIPLSSPTLAVAGLSLHRPGRPLARLGLLLARCLATLGNYSLLRRRVLLIAARDKDKIAPAAATSILAKYFGGMRPDFALYLGTPDDNRKTVVLPLTDSPPKFILKVAQTSRAKASLQNEANALSRLALADIACSVPKLLGLEDEARHLTLVQEYRSRRSVSQWRMKDAVQVFLVKLASIDSSKRCIGDCLPLVEADRGSLPAGVAAAMKSLQVKLRALADNGLFIRTHLSHGDFAPWNCSWSGQGLFVFDWEESVAQAPAFGDAFYYALAPWFHVRRNSNAETALSDALHFAGFLASRLAPDDVALEAYLALWLLPRVSRGPFYGELLLSLDRIWQ